RIRDYAVLALYAIVENLGYRQLTAVWRVLGLWNTLRRKGRWGGVKRRGHERPGGGGPALDKKAAGAANCARRSAMRDDNFKSFVLDQLGSMGGVRAKAMFGGHGLYHDETFFGIVFNGRLYFRADAAAREEYVKRGMKPFRPNRRQTLGRYY